MHPRDLTVLTCNLHCDLLHKEREIKAHILQCATALLSALGSNSGSGDVYTTDAGSVVLWIGITGLAFI